MDVERRASDDVRAAVAEGPFRGRIELRNAAGVVHGDDAVEGGLHDGALAHLTVA